MCGGVDSFKFKLVISASTAANILDFGAAVDEELRRGEDTEGTFGGLSRRAAVPAISFIACKVIGM